MSSERTFTQKDSAVAEGALRRGERPYLIAISGMSAGELYRICRDTTVIGRAEDADVRIFDEGVSRRHAEVALRGNDILLRDLGSTNGTFRNGARVDASVENGALLRDGDKILMGQTTVLKFAYQDDVEEQFHQRMYESAVKDALTGVYNRRYLEDRFRGEFEFARRDQGALALLVLDVDHFKSINDRYGHPAGDRVLGEVGQRLAALARAGDIVARYGGEEFAILCRGADETGAMIMAERLRVAVSDRAFSLAEGEDLRVTISIGVAVARPGRDVDCMKRFLAVADAALYAAKRSGRNRVRCAELGGQRDTRYAE